MFIEAGAGDEAAYVYVDLSGIKNDLIPAVGARISIRVRCISSQSLSSLA